MKNKPDPINPDFIARSKVKAHHEPAEVTAIRGAVVASDKQLPELDVFDEERIRQSLREFARRPGIFDQYVSRLYNHFTKAGEVAYLNNWVLFYKGGRDVIEARTAMERASIEHQQLGYEHEIKKKEKDVMLAKLEADEEEQWLRHARAAFKRQNIEQHLSDGSEPSVPPDEDEDTLKFNAAREKRRKDIQWQIYESLDSPVATLAELQAWRKKAMADVVGNRNLTSDEQTENLTFINTLYERRRTELLTGKAEIFEEE